MHIIKLNAIGSTNTFLKDLVLTSTIKNYTIVTAESQFEGRGQMGETWESKDGENLMFSVFVEHENFLLENSVYLNYVISLTVYDILQEYKLLNLYIKWPNDILADSNKICGMLIENSISFSKIKYSIIGIGINVNQEKFSENINKVSSMKNILGMNIDKEILLGKLANRLKYEIENCIPENFLKIKDRYLSVLYRYKLPTMFQNKEGLMFMGKIVGVTSTGDLEVELSDESIQCFGLKEIKILR